MNTNHARVKEEYGGGIPVFVEGMHQLHCLVFVLSPRIWLAEAK